MKLRRRGLGWGALGAALLCAVLDITVPARQVPAPTVVLLDLSASVGAEIAEILRRGAAWIRDARPRGPVLVVALGGAAPILAGPGDAPSAAGRLEALAGAGMVPPDRLDSRLGPALLAARSALAARGLAGGAEAVLLGDGRTTQADARDAARHLREAGWWCREQRPLAGPAEWVAVAAVAPWPVLRAGEEARVRLRVRGSVLVPRILHGRVAGRPVAPVLEPGGSSDLVVQVRPQASDSVIEAAFEAPPGVHLATPRLIFPVEGSSTLRVAVAGADSRLAAAWLEDAGLEVVLLGLEVPEAARWPAETVLVLAGAPLATPGVDQGIEDRVRRGGGRLLVFGGERAYGPGGYAAGAFDSLLPLRAGGGRRRHLLLALDTSGSMEAGGRLERAQSSVDSLIDRLTGEDRLSVLALGAPAPRWIGPRSGTREEWRRERGRLRELRPAGPTRLLGLLESWPFPEEEPMEERVAILASDLEDAALDAAEGRRALAALLRSGGVRSIVLLLAPTPRTREIAAGLGCEVVEADAVGVDLLLEAGAGGYLREALELVAAVGAPVQGVIAVAGASRVRLAPGGTAWLQDSEARPMGAGAQRGRGHVWAFAPALSDAPALAASLARMVRRLAEEGRTRVVAGPIPGGIEISAPAEPVLVDLLAPAGERRLIPVGLGRYRAALPEGPLEEFRVRDAGGQELPLHLDASALEFELPATRLPGGEAGPGPPSGRGPAWALLAAAALGLSAWAGSGEGGRRGFGARRIPQRFEGRSGR
jgi:hypothetical protein